LSGVRQALDVLHDELQACDCDRGSSIGAQLGAVRLLYAMGETMSYPAILRVLEPLRQYAANNILLTSALMLIGQSF